MIKSLREVNDDNYFQLEKGSTLINGKYRVISKVGSGHGTSVYSIASQKGQKQHIRAVKVESNTVKEPQIKTEVAVLKSIKGTNPDQPGFTQLFQSGQEPEFNYMIVKLLGPNIDQLLKLCGGTFSIKTTMMVGLQVLDRIEVLHNHGYIHGDISPENCMMGLNSESPLVFLADFGRCKKYRNKVTGQHIGYKEGINYSFNHIYASINAHNNVQASRRDDLQSLLYMLNYLCLGRLPWYKPNDTKRKDLNTEELKKRLTPEILCHKMPLEIIDLIYYIKSIQFYEKPDYDFIRKMFYRCLEREQFDNYIKYDWNKLEDTDFKVYNHEPKIVMNGSTATTISQKMDQNVPQSQLEDSNISDREDDQDQESHLVKEK